MLRVLAAVSKLENKEKKDVITLSVASVIDDKNFLCHKMEKSYHTIADSSARVGGGGGSAGYVTESVDYSTMVWLTTNQPHKVADDELLTDIGVIESDNIKKRGGSSYRQLIEAPENETSAFTKEQFIAALKEGKTWRLEKFGTKDCENCFGKGHADALRKYAKCLICDGTGKITVDYLVKW